MHTLEFNDNSTPPSGYVREYVIEYNGYYTTPENGYVLNKKGNINKTTSIRTESPYSFKLNNNYPNPFNPKTTIKFSIPKDDYVSLKIYNSIGQLVQTLVNSNYKSGEYSIDFNGENYPSGVYFYILTSGDYSASKKMVLIK